MAFTLPLTSVLAGAAVVLIGMITYAVQARRLAR
jgi:APA family basic amino acid/polyamine antiporter